VARRASEGPLSMPDLLRRLAPPPFGTGLILRGRPDYFDR
jgi:hypothetical protein